MRRFTGFVVLDGEGRESDFTENPLHTSLVDQLFNLGHACGSGCAVRGTTLVILLTSRGGTLISEIRSCLLQDGGRRIPGEAQAHVSRPACFVN